MWTTVVRVGYVDVEMKEILHAIDVNMPLFLIVSKCYSTDWYSLIHHFRAEKTSWTVQFFYFLMRSTWTQYELEELYDKLLYVASSDIEVEIKK